MFFFCQPVLCVEKADDLPRSLNRLNRGGDFIRVTVINHEDMLQQLYRIFAADASAVPVPPPVVPDHQAVVELARVTMTGAVEFIAYGHEKRRDIDLFRGGVFGGGVKTGTCPR